MLGTWSKLFGNRGSQSTPRRRTLALETLQGRIVPAGISLSAGVISIEGTAKADVVKVELETHNPNTILDDRVRVSLATPGYSLTVWYDRYTNGGLPISRVVFNGYAGDDQFFNLTDLTSVAHGFSGDDILVGGSSKDVLFGDGGDDLVYGNGGNDELHGDVGLPPALAALMQATYGAEGDDYLEGGDGADVMHGEGGSDFLWGGDASDFAYGGIGDDTLYGNDGIDYLYGEQGNDYVSGDKGVDFLYGGDGRDDLRGGSEADYLSGGVGDDTLDGGTGDDALYGGDGEDTLYGREGMDDLYGEGGMDDLYGGDGADHLDGGAAGDYLNGGEVNFADDGDVDVLIGGGGTDFFRHEKFNGVAVELLLFSDYVSGIDLKS